MPPPAEKSPGPSFGVFEVDLRAAELRKSGIRIKLQEQPFQILTMLLEHPGQTVTREELRLRLWPADTFVDFDHSLNSSINKLREALGDNSENPRFIETLHRRGYRFIAPVNSPSEPVPVLAPVQSFRRRFILVASLVSITTLATAGYFYFHRAPKLTNKDTIPFTTFDAPGAGQAAGQGTEWFVINRAGMGVGSYTDASNVLHGFVRIPGGFFKTIDHPKATKFAPTNYAYGTYVLGIDLKGTIAGQYEDANSLFRGFVSNPPYTTFTTIDIPGEATGKGSAGGSNTACLSDEGMIAGYVTNDRLEFFTGYIRQPDGAITTFRAPGMSTTGQLQGILMPQFGNCINDVGAITGWVIDNNFVGHGYVRHPDGSFTMFDAPGAGTGQPQGTFPAAITQEGAIVGFDTDANGVTHGFLRHPDGHFTKIDVPGADKGTFPQSINYEGDIAGRYIDANGVGHSFVLNK